MNEKVIYHLTRIDHDKHGNPQPLGDGNTLRLMTDKLGFKFSKKHDAYTFKYHGNEDQTHKLVKQQIYNAGYIVGTIA
jgi:hypothetical protein